MMTKSPSADKKKSRNRHVLTDDVSTTGLGANPQKSFQVLVLQCGVAGSTSDVDIKFLKLRPYKTTTVHGLLPPDCEARIQNCM
jgi:hypothetical protein